MLTRLKVSGFKNLVDVDVRFGPFTCVAGSNAVGKSNLFDAINFLSALADRSLTDSAMSIRDEAGRTTDLKSLFHCVSDKYDDELSFEADMIVPSEGVDDLGQKAEATNTFLRYSIILAYRKEHDPYDFGRLELLKEELTYITKGDAPDQLLFPHRVLWRESVVKGSRTVPYISTEIDGSNRLITLHQDRRSGSKPLQRSAASLLKTVLSATNAAASPTAFLARQEMRSWRLLQLEPSSLRKPDEFLAPTTLKTDGSHLAANLYSLASKNGQHRKNRQTEVPDVYGQVANRLGELIDDVYDIRIDRDEQRQLLTLLVTGHDGTSYPARALSDGTLRFLALAVIELDPHSKGLICLEEPENGIHPDRIPAMLRLLQDIATDVDEPVGPDNPLRQVIINTHSPSVVAQVPDATLLVAELKEAVRKELRFTRVVFSPLSGTWRDKTPEGASTVAKGKLLAYLNPISNGETNESANSQRVMDRPDLQLLLPYPPQGKSDG